MEGNIVQKTDLLVALLYKAMPLCPATAISSPLALTAVFISGQLGPM